MLKMLTPLKSAFITKSSCFLTTPDGLFITGSNSTLPVNLGKKKRLNMKTSDCRGLLERLVKEQEEIYISQDHLSEEMEEFEDFEDD